MKINIIVFFQEKKIYFVLNKNLLKNFNFFNFNNKHLTR
jgi:hypothetical protein